MGVQFNGPKNGKLKTGDLDLSKISTSANNALNSSFVSVNKQIFGQDNLEYAIRDDGTVAIKNNGTVIGFTTIEAIWGDNGKNPYTDGKTEEEIIAAASKELENLTKIPDTKVQEKIKQRVKEKYGLTDEQLQTILTTPVKPSDAVADAAEGNKPGDSDAMEPDSIDADVEEPASTEEMEGEIPEEEVPDPPITVEDPGTPSDIPAGSPVPGMIPPQGVEAVPFPAQPHLEFTEEELKQFMALVWAECTYPGSPYFYADAMATASAILNRLDSDRYPNDIISVMAASGQFSGYKNKDFNEVYNDPSLYTPEFIEAINRVLNGERNTLSVSFHGSKEVQWKYNFYT